MEGDDVHGVCVPTLGGGLGRHSEAQGEVGHAVDDAALVLGRVLCDPAQARLHHVVAVQELLLRPGLGPHLVLGVRGEEVQGRDVQPELSGLGELSETGSKRN